MIFRACFKFLKWNCKPVLRFKMRFCPYSEPCCSAAERWLLNNNTICSNYLTWFIFSFFEVIFSFSGSLSPSLSIDSFRSRILSLSLAFEAWEYLKLVQSGLFHFEVLGRHLDFELNIVILSSRFFCYCGIYVVNTFWGNIYPVCSGGSKFSDSPLSQPQRW